MSQKGPPIVDLPIVANGSLLDEPEQQILVRAWHLAILRFAVTRDNADRLGVFVIANEIDRLGEPCNKTPPFRFFRKTSAELCASILDRSESADAALRQYLTRIYDARLKRTLAAAIEIDQRDPAVVKRRSKPDNNLWRGLSLKGNVHY